MAARNQQIAEYAAKNAEFKGQYEAGLLRERQAKLMGKQIALTGASGVDLYGSPLDVIGQSYAEGERDIHTTLYNAAYDAWKYRTGGETSLLEGNAVGNRFDTQASLYGQEAGTRESQGNWGLASGILKRPGRAILTGYNKYKYYTGGYGSTAANSPMTGA